ncbi:MAG: type II secretion system protein [Sulfurimonas sp.]|uniref:type II secretion system protein n=1 Tax=Sulfurimonas sp. TaxID=2022749 RepID=UPI00260A4818|nr:type II secretion system protein [Sulfurimonas sp.]MDD5401217.1 type II secretion system protein [Sulfurimonas sp.]
MGKRGFTLIELSIVLTIIGLMIGGSFKVMKMMREKAKTQEAKEQVLAAKNAVIGYASKAYYLPLNSEFDANLSTSKDPNHLMFYAADNNLKYDDICAFNSTALKVNNKGSTIDNVAFVMAHEGANYNMQTGINANTINIYTPFTKIDDNATPINRAEDYDDIVEWVTLEQLKNEVGCVDKPFRFITDKLPNAKVGVLYPDLNASAEAKLVVENNISIVTISCNSVSPKGINFVSPNFSGTPSEAGTATFNCSATETAPSSRTITKSFVITIDPYLNKAKDLNCTQDSECTSGICYAGICRSGTASEPCGNGGDCQSGICVSGICRSGVASDPCVTGGDCKSGLCIGGVCQAGAVTNSCNRGNDCISGFCAGGVCTTGAFGVACDNDNGDCKSGICYNGVCSGAIGQACGGANTNCLSGYCDSNTSKCAITPSGSGSGGGSGGGGGGGGVAPSCTLASSVSVVNMSNPATLNYTIVGGPASGTFSPVSGGCSNFSNSTGGSCTTANLTRNTLFALSVTNAYGSGACSTGVCVATKTEYRIYNDTGARWDFMVDGVCRRVNNNSEITTTAPLRRLNAGESIIQYSSSNTTCSGEVARITFNQVVCADTDADGLVNFSGADR